MMGEPKEIEQEKFKKYLETTFGVRELICPECSQYLNFVALLSHGEKIVRADCGHCGHAESRLYSGDKRIL